MCSICRAKKRRAARNKIRRISERRLSRRISPFSGTIWLCGISKGVFHHGLHKNIKYSRTDLRSGRKSIRKVRRPIRFFSYTVLLYPIPAICNSAGWKIYQNFKYRRSFIAERRSPFVARKRNSFLCPCKGAFFTAPIARGSVTISLAYPKETVTQRKHSRENLVVADCVKCAPAKKRTLTHSIAPPLKITTASLGCNFVSSPFYVLSHRRHTSSCKMDCPPQDKIGALTARCTAITLRVDLHRGTEVTLPCFFLSLLRCARA